MQPSRLVPCHLGPRVLAKLRPLHAWLALLASVRRRDGVTELWIGDSHALCFNRPGSLSMFLRGPDGQLILRVGARLMWSLATRGYPPRVLRVARFVGRFGRPGSVVPVFVAGEIDVRCHLVDHPDDFGFVAGYVERSMALAAGLGATRVVFAVPPPPSASCPNLEEFPIRGSIEQRITAFLGLRAALRDAVAATPGAEILDATEMLGDPTGAMRQELTDDGCHTNRAGVALVRAEVLMLGLGLRAHSAA